MMAEYSLEPIEVEKITTSYRIIKTKLPVPESLVIFKALEESEPRSMMGMPPVIWERAEDFIVSDPWGNRWIDWSSCVLVANTGHGHPSIKAALKEQIDRSMIASYIFAYEKRAELTGALQEVSPDPSDYEVFLLSTGSEAIENCIKLAKTYAMERHGPGKKYIVSFENAFHGRTMGAQLAGGIPKLKAWIGECTPDFVQVPFPNGFWTEDTCFDLFLKTISEKGISGKEIAGLLTESYQGVGPDFLPVQYAKDMESFCREHDIVMIFDEVQAGFGRTGKMFCFEHYGVTPDLIACGKGISSSLPLSAVIGRKEIMEIYPPGSMTSTHSASPLCVVAAIANLKVLKEESLAQRAADLGNILMPELLRIGKKYSRVIGSVTGKGLVAGLRIVKPGTKEPDGDTALRINTACFHRGLLMFAPVGIGGECIKIAPPLTIPEEALCEGISVLEEAMEEVL
ncbi:MAG: aminotransferase class III-fold pyridoxal phosphate-dependent enzyme [Deltaproteobacteria bacterium]|nr:aminotransferase class III-fold pyridoxal phosphate-dependent enzyme [Deltaproteobacteria bacterium]